MSRIWYRRAKPGHRAPRGAVVEALQRSLTESGYDTKGVDGIFGGGTEAALSHCQRDKGLPQTGSLDNKTWSHLLPSAAPPSDFDLALALTMAFEGHGFRKPAGNFDGQRMTWGCIGFVLGFGSLVTVLKRLEATDPAVLSEAFGAEKAASVRAMMALNREDRVAWGDAISHPKKKAKLMPEWDAAWQRLGATPMAQSVQTDLAKEMYWGRAVQDAMTFGLTGVVGHALAFDIAVQNGSINEEAEIAEAMAEEGGTVSQGRRREIIAEAVARGANPRFYNDVLSRKRTIATGSGTVHGARYQIADWGLVD